MAPRATQSQTVERWPNVVPLKGGRLLLCSERPDGVALVVYQHRLAPNEGWLRAAASAQTLELALERALAELLLRTNPRRDDSSGEAARLDAVSRSRKLVAELASYVRATTWGEKLP